MSGIKQVSGKIYLAEQRGCTQSDQYRCLHTFNDGAYQHSDRSPVGILQVFNENTLAGGYSLPVQVPPGVELILLPLVGGVRFEHQEQVHFVEAGSLLSFRPTTDSTGAIANAYDQDLVSYLEIRLEAPNALPEARIERGVFDLDKSRNRLFRLLSASSDPPGFSLLAGKFDGRTDCLYRLDNPLNTLFVFVIDGAFEVQNRLLHPRDGLSLSGLEELELEALSNDAVVVMMEITGKNPDLSCQNRTIQSNDPYR